jgi:hypothetical protein
MWLPEPVYRALPIIYAVTGALFIMGALYLDIREPMGPAYLALGVFSLAAAVVVATWRYKQKDERQRVDTDDSPMA